MMLATQSSSSVIMSHAPTLERPSAPLTPRLATGSLGTQETAPPLDRHMSSLGLSSFSPVNENGSFEFDRIIKAGELLKRGKKTKLYKPIHLVLRPPSLSLYADGEHTALRHRVPVSEITAVARQRKRKKPDAGALFTVFTSARNFYFDAQDEQLADQWVTEIKDAARIDELQDELRPVSSEDDAIMPLQKPRSSSQDRYPVPQGSFSSLSSLGAVNFPGSSISLSAAANATVTDAPARPSGPQRSMSALAIDEERIVRNGWMYMLKSKGGVKKWKLSWVVLRLKSIAVYKNKEEYSALLIIPFPSIIDAVEIDSPSRKKKRQFCMQIITEERNRRFCAMDDEDLAQWLGNLKSLLAKRKGLAESPVQASAPPLTGPS